MSRHETEVQLSGYRAAVLHAILRILEERGRGATTLSDDLLLGAGGLGLDSLDMATIVAELDGVLHKDPFADGVPRFRTVGDLVLLYEPVPQS